MKSDISLLTEKLVAFRDEREWGQFHNPKDLAAALSIEASELLECWLWKKPEDADLSKVREELADVFAYAFLLADRCGLDVREIVLEKIVKNELRYPVTKAKGNARKYTEL
jgi:NTP pyrophosphatase (non-canonical NTP hydrolase)